jgi:glycosyltransferase involved in cell wall biosynthesis
MGAADGKAGRAPTVSVVLTAYNVGPYIAEALRSVLAQTYSDFEIIVVDDGSTDETPTALAPFRHRITYVAQANRGAGAARNTGLRLAKGEFVTFLDADDVWLPNFLEREVRALRRYPRAALAFSGGYQTDSQGHIQRPMLPTAPEAFWAWIGRHGDLASGSVEGHLYRELLLRNFIRTPSAVTLRRAILDGTAGFDETMRNGQDYALWVALARRHSFVFVNAPLVKYRVHGGGLSGDDVARGERWERAGVTVLERELARAPAELRAMLRRRIAASYWLLGWRRFHGNRFPDARPMFRRCIRYRRSHAGAWIYWAVSFLPATAVQTIRRFRKWWHAVLQPGGCEVDDALGAYVPVHGANRVNGVRPGDRSPAAQGANQRAQVGVGVESLVA